MNHVELASNQHVDLCTFPGTLTRSSTIEFCLEYLHTIAQISVGGGSCWHLNSLVIRSYHSIFCPGNQKQKLCYRLLWGSFSLPNRPAVELHLLRKFGRIIKMMKCYVETLTEIDLSAIETVDHGKICVQHISLSRQGFTKAMCNS